MGYKEKYEAALGQARKMLTSEGSILIQKEALAKIFPELGSKDEIMLERIIRILYKDKDTDGRPILTDEIEWLQSKKDVFAHPEKQKESNIDKLRRISTPAEENWLEIQKQWEQEDSADKDERIRKALTKMISDIYGGYPFEKYGIFKKDALAYLEKQKEQKPAEKPGLVAALKHHLSTTPKEQLQKEWDDLKEWCNVGPTVQEFLYGKSVEWSKEDSIGWDEALACVTKAEKAAKNEEELQNAVTAEKWLKEIKFKYGIPLVKQECGEEKLDDFALNIRNLIIRKLTTKSKGPDGSEITCTVFIDDNTAKDIANGVLFYVSKEALKNPNREIPQWNEDDEKAVHFINEFLGYHEKSDPTATECKNWLNERLKSIRPVKQEWSEEDELNLQNCIAKIEIDMLRWGDNGKTMVDGDKELIKWLKARRFIKQEWDEEDEMVYQHCKVILHDYGYDDWFKDHCLQPHWKPSSEQLKAFEEALMLMPAAYIENKIILRAFYEQLKKL